MILCPLSTQKVSVTLLLTGFLLLCSVRGKLVKVPRTTTESIIVVKIEIMFRSFNPVYPKRF